MIRKPAADWHRETRAGATLDAAADVAHRGAKVARTGGHVARGLFCYAFAALWGFAALAAGLFGSIPTLVGVGALAALMAWSGTRAFRKAHHVAMPRRASPMASPRQPSGAWSGGVHTVRYAPAKLVVAAAVSLVLACGAFWLLPTLKGFAALLDGIGAGCLAILALLSAAKLFADPVALSYDMGSLTVATLWRRQTVAWHDIRGIGVRTTTTYALGFIRTARRETLVIKVKGGMTGTKTFSIMGSLLDLGAGRTLVDLAAQLHGVLGMSCLEAVPKLWQDDVPGGQRATPEPQPIASSDPQADKAADVIIARYLAHKMTAEPPQGPPAGHRFGNPIVGQPPRPFGLRVR